MQQAGRLQAPVAEDAGELEHGVDVVGRVEEGEAAGEHGEEDDAGGPDVDGGPLGGALEEDFGGAEAAGAGAVGAARGPGVVFGVRGRGAVQADVGVFDLVDACAGGVLADAVSGVGAFALRKVSERVGRG